MSHQLMFRGLWEVIDRAVEEAKVELENVKVKHYYE